MTTGVSRLQQFSYVLSRCDQQSSALGSDKAENKPLILETP